MLEVNTGGARRGALALDIDETLADTVRFWIRELKLHFPLSQDASEQQLIDRYQFAQNVPEWRDNPQAMDWMERAMVNCDLHLTLPTMPGAVDAVKEIHSNVKPVGFYLSMRPVEVRDATLKWLEMQGFPKAELITRPIGMNRDGANFWKGEEICRRYPQIDSIVEDRLDVVERIPGSYRGTVYLLGHNSAPDLGIHVVPCPDWDRIVTAVREVELSRGRRIDI